MDPPATREAFETLGREYHAAVRRAKEQRKIQRDMKAALMAYMQVNCIETYDLGDCAKLLRKQAKRTEGLKREHIEGELRARLPGGVEDAVANMYNRRVTDVQDVLVVMQGKPI